MATDHSKDEKTTFSERRVSHMSIEDPLSPASNSSDSIYEEEAEEYEDDFREKRLMPVSELIGRSVLRTTCSVVSHKPRHPLCS